MAIRLTTTLRKLYQVWQRFESASLHYVPHLVLQFLMNNPVAGQHIAACGDIECAAIDMRELSSRLLHKQHAG